MEITLRFIDSAYADDPEGYQLFFSRLQGMLDRMGMSHSKYQHNAVPPTMQAATAPMDEVKSLAQRLCMYEMRPGFANEACTCEGLHELDDPSCFLNSRKTDTGNTENLLDVANMAVIESIYPKHPKAHFRSQQASESPGLNYLP